MSLGIAAWLAPARRVPVPADQPLPLLSLGAGEPLRLTVLGTSLTARYGWPETAATLLGGCIGRSVVLARVARPGAGSAWGLAMVDEVLATRPHLVTMEFAINDADLLDGASLRRSRETHEAILSRLQPSAAVLLMTMNPAQGLRGWLRPRLSSFYGIYAALAQDAGAGLLDLHARWLRLPASARGLEGDGLHPAEVVATRVIVPPLVEAIGAAFGRTCGSEGAPRQDQTGRR